VINNVHPFRPLRRRAPPGDWLSIYRSFWSESLDRLVTYVSRLNLKPGAPEMSDLSFQYPKDTPLMITTRTFDAPRALVWKCFSEREHIVRWYGPKSIAPVVRIEAFDFRAGGKWRYVTQRPDGTETIVFFGTFQEIVPMEKIVNTFAVEGLSPESNLLTETHSFEDREGKTSYRAVANLGSIEARDGVLAGGMERGARESMAQLDELLAELQERAR
jgi:uncharacterized protein YndB with AHSA1/START domain